MNRFTISHDIDAAADEFWRLFLDHSFTERHYLEGVRFSEFRILAQRETPATVERKVEAMPRVQLPRAIAKLFGSGFRYIEDGSFDKRSRIWTYQTIPNALSEKIRNEGSIRVEELGPGRVRRVIDVSVDVSIPALGGSIENLAEKTLREGWDASALFMNQWIARSRRSHAAVC